MSIALHPRVLWAAIALTALPGSGSRTALAQPDPAAPKDPARVLIVTGNDYPGHLWRQTAPALRALLEASPSLKVETLEDPNALGSVKLQEFDAVVLHFMNWEAPSPGEQARENLRRAVEAGKGLVLVHFACGAWQDWPEFKSLAGRVWDPKLRGHDPHGTFRVEIADRDHPVTKGMAPFDTTDELYTCLTGDRPIHVIAKARSKVDDKDYPMAFVFDYGKGHVFHTVLGHDVRAITNSAVPELLRRGVLWAAGKDLEKKGAAAVSAPGTMRADTDPVSGQLIITEQGRPVLRYNYRTVEPGDLLQKVDAANLKYAKPRSNYIHPLYGLDGQELTKDWSLEHPHHRGVYWGWAEVDYRGERGDLHALQRVIARPSPAGYALASECGYAQITAENLWLWDDKEPVVRERAIIRGYSAQSGGRSIDLEFEFTALNDDVAVARRGTDQYGGCLNIRFASVDARQITTFTDSTSTTPRGAWADFSGVFGKGTEPAGVTILQSARNPQYPGDWVNYPELNWLQPTFPSAGIRYVLKKGEPLTLRYRLWIHGGAKPTEAVCAEQWRKYATNL